MCIRSLHVESESGLRVRQTARAAEWNGIEVGRPASVDGLDQSIVGAEDNRAVVVVGQSFGIVSNFVWVKILIFVVWVLEVWWCGLQTRERGIAPQFEAIVSALNDPAIRDRFVAVGAEPAPSTPERFSALIRSEIEKWSAVIAKSGAKGN